MSAPRRDPQADAAAQAIASQYGRRDAAADAQRYSLFDAAALQAQQERLRAMVALWRAHGWSSLADRTMLEVGCGSGGNLLDLIRLGAQPQRLTGIELLPDRVALARQRLPASARVIEGDAALIDLPPQGQDAVLAFTLFSSVLDDRQQAALAKAMWSWVRPGGGVLGHDFVVDNPRNSDVRAVPMARWRQLFPEARLTLRRVNLAPPLARALARLHPGTIAPTSALLPFLRTHRLVWAAKP